MKAENMQGFAKVVAQKVAQADSLGLKTSWGTQDHLKVLASLTAGKSEGEVLGILQDCYNISAFQQTLAKTFKDKGHFQRGEKMTLSSTVSALELAVAQATKDAGTAQG